MQAETVEIEPRTPVPMSDDLRERVRAIAKRNRRTMTAQIVVMLEKGVEAEERA